MKNYLFIMLIIALFTTSCATRIVTPAPQTQVVVVKKAPRHHKVVVIKGKRYYNWNGKYHRKTHHGYVVVKL